MDRERLAEDLFRNLNQGRTERLAVTGGNQKTNEGLKQKFIRLEQLKKKEMLKWWDGATLRQYKKLNRIPRGLILNIFPTYDNLDVDLLKRRRTQQQLIQINRYTYRKCGQTGL